MRHRSGIAWSKARAKSKEPAREFLVVILSGTASRALSDSV